MQEFPIVLKKITFLTAFLILGESQHVSAESINIPKISMVSPDNIAYSGPIVITKGGTYSGNWESQNAQLPVIRIQTSEPVIIENSIIRGRGDLIVGFGNRLTIRNVKGYGMNSNILGRPAGRFAVLEEVKNILVENNQIFGTGGMYFRDYRGDKNSSDTIKILKNAIYNIDGRQSNGKDNFTNKRSIAQAIFFNQVQKIPNAEIGWNQVINEPGSSFTEENINMYISSGLPENPILIHDNYIQGAYNARPWEDEDYFGGGILIGDGQSKTAGDSGHIRVYNNQIVGASNLSLSIAGGIDNKVYNNRAIFSGRLPDGRIIAHQSTFGGVVWNPSAQENTKNALFSDNSMNNNYFAITNFSRDGSQRKEQSIWSTTCNTSTISCLNNTDSDFGTRDMELQEYKSWIEKAKSNGIRIGLNN